MGHVEQRAKNDPFINEGLKQLASSSKRKKTKYNENITTEGMRFWYTKRSDGKILPPDLNLDTCRMIAKIALCYFAFAVGGRQVYDPAFDELRNFARNGLKTQGKIIPVYRAQLRNTPKVYEPAHVIQYGLHESFINCSVQLFNHYGYGCIVRGIENKVIGMVKIVESLNDPGFGIGRYQMDNGIYKLIYQKNIDLNELKRMRLRADKVQIGPA